ncbi:hypothetical protein ACN20G_11030 [Streptomyces sp. BI20]|uniref:hypothetical protein n=1 Tax=Streptomyces sp. BI20 TaxID=3403460 RepID=UPI003C769F74
MRRVTDRRPGPTPARPPGRTRGRRRAAALLTGALVLLPAAPALARPLGTADGPGDVALAVGTTSAAALATGLWLRARHRRDHDGDES